MSNDFCAVSNTCDADSTCANGITESTCNCDVQDTQMCRQYMSSTDQSWPDMNFDDARVKCFADGGRLLRITSSLDLLSLDLASSFDQDCFRGHSVRSTGSIEVIFALTLKPDESHYFMQNSIMASGHLMDHRSTRISGQPEVYLMELPANVPKLSMITVNT